MVVSIRLCALAALATLMITGCTPLFKLGDIPSELPKESYISSFPFFAQKEFHCAPAAAAMVLTHLGYGVTPDEIADTIYTAGRKGSFQLDLISSLRRQGTIPYQIDQDISSLLTAIDNGDPVIVLLNLGLSWIPTYHYGVVTGYNLNTGQIHFTSGEKEDERFDINTFARMWNRVDNWGLVVINPENITGENIPDYVDEIKFLMSAAALEHVGSTGNAKKIYLAALDKWGHTTPILMSLGNVALKEKNYKDAVLWFKKAVSSNPTSSIILNNYAWALAHSQQWQEAHKNAKLAVEYDKGECGGNCRSTLSFIEGH